MSRKALIGYREVYIMRRIRNYKENLIKNGTEDYWGNFGYSVTRIINIMKAIGGIKDNTN